jgi:ribonuclease D
MTPSWTLVDSPALQAEAQAAIGSASVIALDTEYDSFRYFHDRLCLIQIQTGHHTWIIDPLAGLDLSFLGRVFSDPAVLKLMHAGDNDIRILKRDYRFTFCTLFDTHRAASLLGIRQLALDKLIDTYLGIRLQKTMQRSRWDLRPLSHEQLDYASLDTACLNDLYGRLAAEIREKGLDREAARLFAGMAEVVWRPKTLDPVAYRKLPGFADLHPAQREKAKRLLRWRFEKGRELNRAPFMVLSDTQLAGLARIEPATGAALSGSGLLSADKARHFGDELLALLNESSQK